MSRENLSKNGLDGRVGIITGDLREYRQLTAAESFDFVVSNPPYFAERSGYSAPLEHRAASREERSCTLGDICAAAGWALRWGGSFALVHRPERLSEIFCAMRFGSEWVWATVIGVLIILWIVVGVSNLGRLNTVAMAGLFVLTAVLSTTVFRGGAAAASGSEGGLSFGAAVELSSAMPLSWLPLIADYTRTARNKRAATLTSSVTYFLTSCWMYVIGLGAAIYTGESDISKIMA